MGVNQTAHWAFGESKGDGRDPPALGGVRCWCVSCGLGLVFVL